MIKKIAGAVLVAACTALSASAYAVPVTLNGSIADNTLLSAGTVSGVFDGTSVLPASYTLNSLSFSFTFTDDNDALTSSTTTSTSTGDYSAASLLTYVRDATTTKTVTTTGQAESVTLALAGVNVGSGATALTQSSSTTTSDGQLSLDSKTCFILCLSKYTDSITVTNTSTQDWTGSFTISGTITDLAILNQLMSTDQLLYSMQVTGDVYLTSAQLSLDITPTTASAVPEPSTIALALLGLGGIGFSRLRRRQRG